MASYKVTNLKLAMQSGTTDTLYATWEFKETTTTTTNTSTIKKGTVVKIKTGAKYYNGASIPDWVIAKQWIVLQVDGDRVVIDKSTDGENSICSAVNAKDLTVMSGGGSSSSSTTTTDIKNLDYFEVKWQYWTGDGVWFAGTTENVTTKQSIWSFPSNARSVRIFVKPVSKKDKNDKSYWTGTEEGAEYKLTESKPDQPSAPSVKIEKYTLTAELTDIRDGKADEIEFEVVKGTDKFTSGIATVKTQMASFSCEITAGAKYRVRCRAINKIKDNDKTYGEWSSYSNEVSTIPLSVTNVSIAVESETSVRLSWTGCENSTGYTVEYTTNKSYFDSSTEVGSTNVTNTTAYITGLETGDEWFFRVRATNNEGESGWSNIVSTIIGTEPSAPTTWSSTTTAVVGEDIVILYWVHNTEDGSHQTAAEIELDVNGVPNTISVDKTTPDDEKEGTYSYNLNVSNYSEGAVIKWRVRTRGIVTSGDNEGWSEWSIQRTIDLYAPPTLSVQANGTLTAFPYDIKLTAGPNTQVVLSYHISIVANGTYETIDVTGESLYIVAGQEVYSKIFNVSTNPLTVTISAGDVTFENGQSYKIVATVAMNSGMVAEATSTFSVRWSDTDIYTPNAAIAIDRKSFAAYISPFCVDDRDYITNEVTLSVYRREHNGSLTLIGSELTNNGSITVTDPHPSLDYARYRIVAIHKDTGVVSFEDLPGEPIKEHSIIIQWNEKWSQFDYDEDATPETPPWTGSLVRLPYNIKVTENYSPDVSLIEYIGRKHPVSYYGTQKGESGSWSSDIPKYDKETIYNLRRLADWDGDVYVREPSGIGYWAKVNVSFPISYDSLIIPVTISTQRVEGGI